MPATANNDEIIVFLRLGIAPRRGPPFVTGQRLFKDAQSIISHASPHCVLLSASRDKNDRRKPVCLRFCDTLCRKLITTLAEVSPTNEPLSFRAALFGVPKPLQVNIDQRAKALETNTKQFARVESLANRAAFDPKPIQQSASCNTKAAQFRI